MEKFARLQAQANALCKGEDAAMGTVETILLLVVTIIVVALLFVFVKEKADTAALGSVETAMTKAGTAGTAAKTAIAGADIFAPGP